MLIAFLQKQKQWEAFRVYGSQARLVSGIASTLRAPRGCPSSWFSGNSTIILGAGDAAGEEVYDETVASWDIAVAPEWIQNLQRGFLIVACRRYFGGLHSKEFGAGIEILVNDQHTDGFKLKVVPPNHSDYFHRIPTPVELPSLWPIGGCQTVYVWQVLKDQLTESGNQTVTVRIERNVNWDIDYVAFALESEFVSREPTKWIQKILFILLGVILAGIVSLAIG